MIKRIIPAIVYFLLLAGIFVFLPPKNFYYVFLFVLVVGLFSLSFLKIFLSRKNSFLATLFIMSFLIVNYLVGFSLLNTILLICLFITIKVLLK